MYLKVLWLGWDRAIIELYKWGYIWISIISLDYLFVKIYILVILSIYNYLCKIYYAFKKKFRYAIIIWKDEKHNK